MRFQVLGPLAVEAGDDHAPIGHYRQRSVLALLLIHRNEVVSVDRIIDDLWGDDASPERKSSLHVYLSNLRRALDPDRERRSEGEVLRTRLPGYVLVCGPDDVDADVFERRVDAGVALVGGDPEAASIALGDALGMWHGVAYEEFTYEPWAQDEIGRLAELRLHAVEARIDADLGRGLDRQLVSELGSLVREHPLRERFTEQLMLALYRSGRQAEALRAYRMLSGRLADELGITPSPSTQRLEERVVMADPGLIEDHDPDISPRAKVVTSVRTVRGYELRDRVAEGATGDVYRAYQPSVGREVAIKVYGAELADEPGFVRRFGDSARRVASLRAEGIVPVYDYWREPGAAYVVERLMLGGSLDRRLGQGSLSRDEASSIVMRVGGVLAEAHRLGITHGAVHAGNILFDSDGAAYLTGFPIGVGADAGEEEADHLQRGHADQRGLATVAAELVAGRRGVLSELLVGMDPGHGAVLSIAGAGDYADVAASTEAIREALADGQVVVETKVPNPYKGLRPFGQGDADDFFGRDREIERLIGRLGDTSRSSRFVALVGPSGSGKSSLVRAGLIPALRRDAVSGSALWFIVEMVPGRYPYEALEDALLSVAVDPPASLLTLLTSEGGIARTADEILPDDGSQLVIVVDQLEELFTHADPATANRFLKSLTDAVTRAGRVRVVCTLRADFYDRPLAHTAFGELLRNGTEVITPMPGAGLDQAITRPADRVGVTVDRSLVAEIVADVVERPAALPLLQYALTEMFEVRDRNVITPSAYHRVGGALGALVQRAEGLYAALEAPAKDVARQVFLRLVSVGSSGGEDTRRRALVGELTSFGTRARHVQHVLDVFGHHRLITFDRDLVTRGPTVEISHEALLTEWDRLANWIDDARIDIRTQRRLTDAMREWEEAGRTDDYLVAGGLLDQLAGWATSSPIELTDDEASFLATSVARRNSLAIAESERERERDVAVRRSRRRLQLLAGLGIVAIVVALLAGFAWRQRGEANRLAADANRLAAEAEGREKAGRLADQAVRQTGIDPQLAMLLALSAADASAHLEELPITVEEAMHMAFQSARLTYPGDAEDVQTAVTPKGIRGYYTVAPDQLAQTMITGLRRGFTPTECATFDIEPCATRPGDVVDVASLPPVTDRSPGTLDGTSVAIAHDFEGFPLELEAFTEVSGIEVDQLPPAGIGVQSELVSMTESLVDVSVWTEPANVRELDAQIGLVDLSLYLDENLPDVYGDYLLDLVSDDDERLLGLPIALDLKGIIYYPPERFADAGLDPPRSWQEMIEVSDEIVDHGGAPWCIGLQHFSDDGDGWIGTDFIEDLVITFAGVETYDTWAAHEIPFDDPAVVDALKRFETLVSGDGYVPLGREAITSTPWWLGFERMFPSGGTACWMVHAGSYIGDLGEDEIASIDFFTLDGPLSQKPGYVGGAKFAAAVTDRPEVRAFLRFLSGDTYGQRWAEDEYFLAPQIAFDPAFFGPEDDPYANLLRRFQAIVSDALARDTWRFDASDLMPPAIGNATDEGLPGAFFQAMLDLADGTITAEEAARRVEEAWRQLELQDG